MTQSKFIRPALLAILLGGCSSTGSDGYPSLAIRDVERVEGTFETAPAKPLDVPPVEVDLTGGLEARLAALVEQARKAHADFISSQSSAERLAAAASGAAVGSDSWAAAQVALADLDSSRSIAAVALGDLDIIYAATTVQGADTAAVSAARGRVIEMIRAEDSTLERLRGMVP